MDQRIQIAFQHAIHVADGKLGAMILHHAIRREHVAADLAPEVDLQLRILHLAVGGALLVHLMLVQLGAKLLHRRGAILMLAALVLALHHDVGGKVRHANRRIGAIDVLAARA